MSYPMIGPRGVRAGLALALAFAATPALAQDFTLGAGFTPDPQVGSGVTGGDGNAARFGNGCTGSIGARPDHRIRVTSPVNLRLTVTSDTDSTLAVIGPSGVFCDDDGGDLLDARVDARLDPGDYQVFVGHYERQGRYRLELSELVGGAGRGADKGRYGDFVLGAGFMPDPQTASGQTGGSVQATRYGAHCSGVIDTTPDHTLTVTSTVSLDIRVDSTTDSSLVITGPGKVLCDDDGGGMLDARVRDTFRPGEYGIYIGHLGTAGEYTVTISEAA